MIPLFAPKATASLEGLPTCFFVPTLSTSRTEPWDVFPFPHSTDKMLRVRIKTMLYHINACLLVQKEEQKQENLPWHGCKVTFSGQGDQLQLSSLPWLVATWVRSCFRSSHPSECGHNIATTTAASLALWFAFDIGLELTVSMASNWARSSQGYPAGNLQLKLSLSSTANEKFTCGDCKHKTPIPISPSLTLSGYQAKNFPRKHNWVLLAWVLPQRGSDKH